MATATVIESLNTATTNRKRKAAEADLPERAEAETGGSTNDGSDSKHDDEPNYLLRNFVAMWNTFYRPELEKVYGPDPTDPARVSPTVPVSLPPVEESKSPELTPLTHGGGLDEFDDQAYVLTQPFHDCECGDCKAAGEGVIQCSESE